MKILALSINEDVHGGALRGALRKLFGEPTIDHRFLALGANPEPETLDNLNRQLTSLGIDPNNYRCLAVQTKAKWLEELRAQYPEHSFYVFSEGTGDTKIDIWIVTDSGRTQVMSRGEIIANT